VKGRPQLLLLLFSRQPMWATAVTADVAIWVAAIERPFTRQPERLSHCLSERVKRLRPCDVKRCSRCIHACKNRALNGALVAKDRLTGHLSGESQDLHRGHLLGQRLTALMQVPVVIRGSMPTLTSMCSNCRSAIHLAHRDHRVLPCSHNCHTRRFFADFTLRGVPRDYSASDIAHYSSTAWLL
jgi:hypothetical protein